MTTKTMQELHEMVKLLREADALTDADVRKRVQHLILESASVPAQTLEVAIIPPARFNPIALPVNGATHKKAKRGPSQSTKVLEVLKVLATREKPLSGADLSGMVEGVPDESLPRALSDLYRDKKVYRIQVFDQNIRGNHQTLYKYYVDPSQVGDVEGEVQP